MVNYSGKNVSIGILDACNIRGLPERKFGLNRTEHVIPLAEGEILYTHKHSMLFKCDNISVACCFFLLSSPLCSFKQSG